MEETKFDKWLSERFRDLNTDEAVFVPYIKSIVEGDETLEEKIDALDEILGELAETDGNLNVKAFRTEIMNGWDQHCKESADALSNTEDVNASSELDSKLEKLLKLNDNHITTKTSLQQGNQKTSKVLEETQVPDSTLRAAILNQCQNVSDNESDGERPNAAVTSSGSSLGAAGFERNTNAERVQNELKDKRDMEKAEAAKKREKDKEDRAKQKQQAQDRKDRAKKKASKVERKR